MVDTAEAEAPSFPELLRFRRVQAGLTQRTLADLSTISPRTIRALESGRANARVQTVRLLADALGLDGLTRELFVNAGLGNRRQDPGGTAPGLPAPGSVNALLGRDAEVRAMVGALASGHRRMISVSGLPGVGKSRLAAEVAARLSSRRGWPVLWTGAGTTAAPDGHGTAFGGLLTSLRRLVESGTGDAPTLCRLIGRHEALLVLDGVDGTGSPAGVAQLLAYCPGVRVLSTSRAPWLLAGVQGAVVAPLAVPGPDWEETRSLEALAGVPSVRLLVERLAEVRPGFVLGPSDADAAVRLCRALDGLPAALEAVAAGFRVLSLRRLAQTPVRTLLDLSAPTRSAGGPGTIGGLLRSGFEHLDAAHRTTLDELARLDRAPTVPEAAQALHRPLHRLVDDLGALTGRGLVRASYEDAEPRLHLPNLLRAVLALG